MTRICSWCGAVLGEKCARCGGPAEKITPDGKRWKCFGACQRAFPAGQGGVTHGICELCKAGVPPVINALLPPDVFS